MFNPERWCTGDASSTGQPTAICLGSAIKTSTGPHCSHEDWQLTLNLCCRGYRNVKCSAVRLLVNISDVCLRGDEMESPSCRKTSPIQTAACLERTLSIHPRWPPPTPQSRHSPTSQIHLSLLRRFSPRSCLFIFFRHPRRKIKNVDLIGGGL